MMYIIYNTRRAQIVNPAALVKMVRWLFFGVFRGLMPVRLSIMSSSWFLAFYDILYTKCSGAEVVIIGFIGTGTITSCVVKGLLAAQRPISGIVVSPRNAHQAAALVNEFSLVSVAADNQSVINQSDILCIAVRPQDAGPILNELQFKEDSTVISFMSTYSLSEIRTRVAPAKRVFRMLPLPPVERGQGPVALHPPDPALQTTFEGIGTLIPVVEEESLNSLLAVTAMMASYFGFLDSVSQWLRDHDLPGEQADAFTGSLFHALSVTALSVRDEGFAKLALEHATKGGLNEQLLRELAANDWLSLPKSGLDLILDRLEGRAELESKLSRTQSGEHHVS
jgi:pyrroline-5-carboxylate reductase